MRPRPLLFLYGAILTMLVACRTRPATEDPAIWQKITFDVNRLDHNGLSGTAGGKVAVNYEFCIPAEPRYLAEVSAIDTTARRTAGRGRIGCNARQWLVIGSTQQPNHRRVLYGLARLPYVARIDEVFWE